MTVGQWKRHRPRCTLDGKEVRLARNEAELLASLLVHHPDKSVHVSTLIQSVWDPDDEPATAEKIIRITIMRLRRKRVHILTDFNFGWRVPAGGRTILRPFCRQPSSCKAIGTRGKLKACVSCAMTVSWQSRLNELQSRVLAEISADPLESYKSIAKRLDMKQSVVQSIATALQHRGLAPTQEERIMLRQSRLRDIITSSGPLTQREMAARVGVTEFTIKRDLLDMEEAGAIQYPHSKHRGVRATAQ